MRLPAKENFDAIVQEKKTALFYLKNDSGIEAALCNYGARMVSFLVPDRSGNLVDINVGFDCIADYVNAQDQCYGAVVGRYAGRIAKGKFNLDGEVFQLDVNNGNNAIHGGNTGFQTRVWDATQLNDHAVQFNYVSEDEEEGYPGRFSVQVIYSLNNDDELKIEFEYSSNKKTIVNIINHNFWNLNGEGSGLVNNHQLQINAEKFNAINEDCIPVAVVPVEHTPFDFRSLHTIGSRIGEDDEQLKNGTGYDHTYALENVESDVPQLAATAIGERSGIKMDVYTTEPGVHFYTGNFMQGLHTFKCGAKDESRTAFCLETQGYPNAPNNPLAPSTVKNAGEVYKSTTVHRFSIEPKK